MNSLEVYLKAMPINAIGVLVDIITMYIIGHYTNLPVGYQVYISSILRMSISYVGYFKFTFKSKKNFKKTAVKFLIWEIISLTVVSELTIFINNVIVDQIHKIPHQKGNTKSCKDEFRNIFLQDKNGQYELKTYITIVLKHIVIMVFNLLVEIPVYKYIF